MPGLDLASGFPSLTFGRRTPAGAEYICHTPRPSLPSFAPTFWFSDTDQSDPSNEIYCRLVNPGYGGVARKVLQLLTRGVP